MDEEDLDEFIYEFHERVLGIEPEQNERPEWDWIRKKQSMTHSNRKSILYHLGILDENSEISTDHSEYPCQFLNFHNLTTDYTLLRNSFNE